ncbi:DNA replication protein DnaC [Bradyrhizobium elkanii]
MNTANTVDTARLNLLLNELRLPAIKVLWPQFAEQSDKEGWPAARFLATIAEHEIAERGRRRIERHLVDARLPAGKTFDNFDFEAVPMISKAQVTALAAGDGWLGKGANLLLFGPPGGGKSHLASALGLALIENGWRVLFTRTTDLVQKLQVARRELNLEAAINRLDRFDLLILDDLAYVTKDQAETSVLFELISARYERRSMLITANQPFGEWNRVFPDPAMTLAAIDRLVHHATIVEMNVESYRRRTALERKRGPGRPPSANENADLDARRHTRHPKPSLIDAPRQSEFKKLLRATINAAIITSPRHRLAILIVVRFPPRLSRYRHLRVQGRERPGGRPGSVPGCCKGGFSRTRLIPIGRVSGPAQPGGNPAGTHAVSQHRASGDQSRDAR